MQEDDEEYLDEVAEPIDDGWRDSPCSAIENSIFIIQALEEIDAGGKYLEFTEDRDKALMRSFEVIKQAQNLMMKQFKGQLKAIK